MDKLARLFDYFSLDAFRYGSSFCLLILSVYCGLPPRIRAYSDKGLNAVKYDGVALVLIGLFVAVGIAYVAYPNYLDPFESTIAALGKIMQRGDPLYPWPDTFPYHGILYGPAMAELQSAFSLLGLPVLLGSKLPGFIAFAITIPLLLHLNKQRLSRGYLLYLLPFGSMLFWDRSEPFFLLLVSSSLLAGVHLRHWRYLPILFAILAGVASAFKIHGALYIIAAFIAVTMTVGVSLPTSILLASCAVFFTSFFVVFLPSNVSFFAFVAYLKSASHHGLALTMWLKNLLYFAFLNAPIFLLWRQTSATKNETTRLLAILFVEFLVSIIASKVGAGTHHLLPFIPINAFLIEKYFLAKNPDLGSNKIRLLYAALVVPVICAAWSPTAVMAREWHRFAGANAELRSLVRRYPDAVMGATDTENISFSQLRVALVVPQIDYPFYMDLQASGIGDGSLSRRLNDCAITRLVMPNEGAPFSLINYYTAKPLFSDATRQAFSRNFHSVAVGKYFTTYNCSRRAPAADQEMPHGSKAA